MTYTPSENIPNPNHSILHNFASTKFGLRNKSKLWEKTKIYYLFLSLELQIHFIFEANRATQFLSSVQDGQHLM